MTVHIVLLLFALVCFIAATAEVQWKINWIGLGLAFAVLSFLIPG